MIVICSRKSNPASPLREPSMMTSKKAVFVNSNFSSHHNVNILFDGLIYSSSNGKKLASEKNKTSAKRKKKTMIEKNQHLKITTK